MFLEDYNKKYLAKLFTALQWFRQCGCRRAMMFNTKVQIKISNFTAMIKAVYAVIIVPAQGNEFIF